MRGVRDVCATAAWGLPVLHLLFSLLWKLLGSYDLPEGVCWLPPGYILHAR